MGKSVIIEHVSCPSEFIPSHVTGSWFLLHWQSTAGSYPQSGNFQSMTLSSVSFKIFKVNPDPDAPALRTLIPFVELPFQGLYMGVVRFSLFKEQPRLKPGI